MFQDAFSLTYISVGDALLITETKYSLSNTLNKWYVPSIGSGLL